MCSSNGCPTAPVAVATMAPGCVKRGGRDGHAGGGRVAEGGDGERAGVDVGDKDKARHVHRRHGLHPHRLPDACQPPGVMRTDGPL